MKNGIDDFLPAPRITKIAQAQIPSDLHRRVTEQMEADRGKKIRMDWTVLIEAACKDYLRVRGAKK